MQQRRTTQRAKKPFAGKGTPPFAERIEGGQEYIVSVFYGVRLDKNDPFLSHNLNRLEKRFRERHEASDKKNKLRERKGKHPHQTVLKSIRDNRNRVLMIKVLKRLYDK